MVGGASGSAAESDNPYAFLPWEPMELHPSEVALLAPEDLAEWAADPAHTSQLAKVFRLGDDHTRRILVKNAAQFPDDFVEAIFEAPYHVGYIPHNAQASDDVLERVETWGVEHTRNIDRKRPRVGAEALAEIDFHRRPLKHETFEAILEPVREVREATDERYRPASTGARSGYRDIGPSKLAAFVFRSAKNPPPDLVVELIQLASSDVEIVDALIQHKALEPEHVAELIRSTSLSTDTLVWIAEQKRLRDDAGVREALEGLDNPSVTATLGESLSPEEFRDLVVRLIDEDAERALTMLQRGEQSQRQAVDTNDIMPLVQHRDASVRLRGIGLLQDLWIGPQAAPDPSAPEPEAPSAADPPETHGRSPLP